MEFKVARDTLGDRQQHQVILVIHECKAIQTPVHNTFAATSMWLECLVALKCAYNNNNNMG